MLKIKIGLLLCVSLVISACGGGKNSSVPEFYGKNSVAIQNQLSTMLDAKKYAYVFHIHFRGNDFGWKKGDEKWVDLAPGANHPLRNKAHPFQTLSLNAEDT